ncbi:radical SAM/SPASM domain-containing protein [Patescibacteria group bacterium]
MKLSKRISFFTTLLKTKITGKNVPLVVVLNITNRCNFRCIYCYGPYYDSPKNDFTTEQLLKLIDELAILGTKSITLGGGEPLLRDDIGQIIDYIKSKEIECGMNTNGCLIPKKIDSVKKLDLICVSIDGDQESNDANRGEGTFRKIIDGIKTAKEAGLIVHTNTVLTKNNLDSIDYLINLAKDMGFESEFNLPFYQISSNKDNPALALSNEDSHKAIKKIMSFKKMGYPVLFSEKVHRYVANWPDYREKMFLGKAPNFSYIKCQAGRYMCFIDADGMVYPCAQLIGSFKSLNFLKVGFRRAWENLSNHNCKACYFVCFNELNSIFNFDISVILSNVLTSVKESLLKKNR